MQIPKLQLAVFFAAGVLLAAVPALAADNTNQQQGSAVVTVLPKTEIPGGISQQALHLKVDGKDSTVTGWTPLRGSDGKVEMVVLIDDGARQSLGLHPLAMLFLLKQGPENRIEPVGAAKLPGNCLGTCSSSRTTRSW